MKQSLVLLCLLLTGMVVKAQHWTPLGLSQPNLIGKFNYGTYADVVIAKDGTPYMSFADDSSPLTNYRLSVKRLVNGRWTYVGDSCISANSIFESTALALDTNGMPVVAYREGGGITVKRWTDTAWSYLGTSGIGQISPDKMVLRIAKDGNIYFAYNEWSYFHLKKFNSSNWVDAAPPIYGALQDFNIKLDTGGIPAVVVSTASPYNEVRAYKLSGNAWINYGIVGNGRGASLAFSADNKLYVSRSNTNYGNQCQISVKNASGWVGIAGNTTSCLSADIVFDSTGVLYSVCSSTNNGGISPMVFIHKYAASTFIETVVGSNKIVEEPVNSVHINIAPGGIPVVNYSTSYGFFTQEIKYLDNNNKWRPYGDNGIVPYEIDKVAIVADTMNNVYIAYRETDGTIGTSMWNGSDWIFLGTVDSNAYYVYDLFDLAINKLGVPYIASDRGGAGLAVRRWDGTAWTQVGTNVNINVEQINLKFDTSGNPYLSYNNPVLNSWYGGAVVQHWDGTTWQNVGQAPIMNFPTSNQSLNISPNGTPYLLYTDGNDNQTKVREWTGTTWAVLDTAVGPSSSDFGRSIVIDTAQAPTVYYVNDTSLIIKKYDSANWVDVTNGASCARTKYTGWIDAECNGNNVTYVGNAGAYYGDMHLYKNSDTSWSELPVNNVKGQLFQYAMALNDHYIYTVFSASWGLLAAMYDDSPPPVATITATADTICIGSSAAFTSNVINGGANAAYQWRKNGVAISGATAATYSTAALQTGDSIDVIVTGSTLGHYKDTSNAVAVYVDTAFIFTGAMDNLWSNPANWCGGMVPGPGNDVHVLAGVTLNIDVAGAQCLNFVLRPGAVLQFAGSGSVLHVAGSMQNDGTVYTTGGMLQIDNP